MSTSTSGRRACGARGAGLRTGAAAAADGSSPNTSAAAAARVADRVRVRLSFTREVMFGESFVLAGSAPALGGWDLAGAVEMKWGDGHEWSAEVELPSGCGVEWKVLKRRGDGTVDYAWKEGEAADTNHMLFTTLGREGAEPSRCSAPGFTITDLERLSSTGLALAPYGGENGAVNGSNGVNGAKGKEFQGDMHIHFDSGNFQATTTKTTTTVVETTTIGPPQQERGMRNANKRFWPSLPMFGKSGEGGGAEALSGDVLDVEILALPSASDGDYSGPCMFAWTLGGGSVQVAGSFNGWKDPVQMQLDEATGVWSKEIIVPGGQHSFKFLVDGAWRVDDRMPIMEDDGGNHNNVVSIKGDGSVTLAVPPDFGGFAGAASPQKVGIGSVSLPLEAAQDNWADAPSDGLGGIDGFLSSLGIPLEFAQAFHAHGVHSVGDLRFVTRQELGDVMRLPLVYARKVAASLPFPIE